MLKKLRFVSSRVGLVVLFLSLSSCSTFGFLFDRLPWLSTWQLSSMFDLSESQEAMVESAAEKMQHWFVVEGFPNLINDLERANKRWGGQVSANTVHLLIDDLNRNVDAMLFALSPMVVPLALDLDAKNLASFRDYMDERRSEWFDSLHSEQDKEDQRVERLEDWFGNLLRDQVLLVRESVFLLPNELGIRQQNSLHWVEQFQLAVQRQDVDALGAWVADPSIWWTDEYAALRSDNLQQLRQLLDVLVPTLTQTQISHARREVQDWVDVLSDIVESHSLGD